MPYLPLSEILQALLHCIVWLIMNWQNCANRTSQWRQSLWRTWSHSCRHLNETCFLQGCKLFLLWYTISRDQWSAFFMKRGSSFLSDISVETIISSVFAITLYKASWKKKKAITRFFLFCDWLSVLVTILSQECINRVQFSSFFPFIILAQRVTRTHDYPLKLHDIDDDDAHNTYWTSNTVVAK